MKTNAILFMAMLMGSSAIFAQQKPDRSNIAERQTQKMKTELSLSFDQVGKVDQINQKFASRHANLRADSTQTRVDRLAERKRLQEEKNAEIRGVLTAKQFLQWTVINEKQRNSNDPKGKGGTSRKDEMTELKAKLKLSDEQYKKMIATNTRMAGQLKQIRKDTTVPTVEFREAWTKIRLEKNDAIRKLLTTEQYEKFLAYETEKMNQRRGGGAARGKQRRG